MDPAHYEIARKRLARGYTPSFDFEPPQAALDLDEVAP
jgi:hypothetical protein